MKKTSLRERLRRSLLLTLGFSAMLIVSSSQALVIDDGNGHGSVSAEDNASVPSCPLSNGDEFIFLDNVGIVGDGSGVYIGEGWVITSSHVGCQPIRLRGQIFNPTESSWRVLLNDEGGESEVAIFRIADWENSKVLLELSSIPIAHKPIESGQRVVMAAAGFTTSGKKEILKISNRNDAVLGHYLRPVRELQYGFASVDSICQERVKTKGGMTTDSLITSFGRGKGMAQATAGDSGGAVFVYNKELSTWELGGCIFAVSHKSKYVPFGARTYVARLDVHHDSLIGNGILNWESRQHDNFHQCNSECDGLELFFGESPGFRPQERIEQVRKNSLTAG